MSIRKFNVPIIVIFAMTDCGAWNYVMNVLEEYDREETPIDRRWNLIEFNSNRYYYKNYGEFLDDPLQRSSDFPQNYEKAFINIIDICDTLKLPTIIFVDHVWQQNILKKCAEEGIPTCCIYPQDIVDVVHSHIYSKQYDEFCENHPELAFGSESLKNLGLSHIDYKVVGMIIKQWTTKAQNELSKEFHHI